MTSSRKSPSKPPNNEKKRLHKKQPPPPSSGMIFSCWRILLFCLCFLCGGMYYLRWQLQWSDEFLLGAVPLTKDGTPLQSSSLSSSTTVQTTTKRVPDEEKVVVAQPIDTTHHGQHGTLPQTIIPRRLIFTYKWNLFDRPHPKHLSDNVKHTIEAYRQRWRQNNEPMEEEEILMLDDAACQREVNITAPFLLRYFLMEPKGAYRGDICRVCALLRYGGYYFDVDMETIEPFVAAPGTDFVTVNEAGQRHFFQSFLASTPGHAILQETLNEIHTFYQTKRFKRAGESIWMGPYTLKQAYLKVVGNRDSKVNNASIVLLDEINLKDNPSKYPQVARRQGEGCCCNYVVLQADQLGAHFYSRMIGAGPHCDFP